MDFTNLLQWTTAVIYGAMLYPVDGVRSSWTTLSVEVD